MKKIPFFCSLFLFMFSLFFAAGCGPGKSDPGEPPVFDTPTVLVPEESGTEVLGNPPASLDVSHKEQGYMIARAEESASDISIQMTGPDGVLYSYFIRPGNAAVIPFTGGEGSYQILCYEQVSGDKYAALSSNTVEVTLENIFLPFLYPNQYVDFTPDSEACLLAQSMLAEDASDLDALDAVYNYVISNITYDEEKAAAVEAGYLPDIDETLETGIGICFDYAALMTAMLRARDIPCKLQIGYTSDIKHAWIDVYIRSKGWINHAISFDGETWSRMDPTFDSNADDADSIQEYIGDGDNYTVQFTR